MGENVNYRPLVLDVRKLVNVFVCGMNFNFESLYFGSLVFAHSCPVARLGNDSVSGGKRKGCILFFFFY